MKETVAEAPSRPVFLSRTQWAAVRKCNPLLRRDPLQRELETLEVPTPVWVERKSLRLPEVITTALAFGAKVRTKKSIANVLRNFMIGTKETKVLAVYLRKGFPPIPHLP